MQKLDIHLDDVRQVYSGPEGRLWELIMGEQIHAGGFQSSMRLARSAGIEPGMHGVDLCCCIGGGVRFLIKNFGCNMAGVDGTEYVLSEAARRAKAEGLDGRAEFALCDVTQVPYENGRFDFVWGEDAWCYVDDKERLIREAFRVLKPGGRIAFTDWIEGPQGLSDEEALRICTFMKFPYMESLSGYERLLREAGFVDVASQDLTEEFAGHCDLYIRMLVEQLTFDALKIIGDDMELLTAMGAEMDAMRQCAHEGKMGRGQFTAWKPT